MSARRVLDALPTDEWEAFVSMTPSDDPEGLVGEAFAAAVEFGDEGSIRELRLLLHRQVRGLGFRRIIEALRSFADDEGELGVAARAMLRVPDGPCLPDAAHNFVHAFACVVAHALYDSMSRAGRRRRRLIKALLDEAATIEKGRAA